MPACDERLSDDGCNEDGLYNDVDSEGSSAEGTGGRRSGCVKADAGGVRARPSVWMEPSRKGARERLRVLNKGGASNYPPAQ